MARLCKRHWTRTIDTASEIISASWYNESSEVYAYCERLVQVEKMRQGDATCSDSLKRATTSTPEDGSTSSGSGGNESSTKKPRLASTEKTDKGEEMEPQVGESSLKGTGMFGLSGLHFTKYSEDDHVQKDGEAKHDTCIKHIINDGAYEELPHHITFESTGSQDEGSLTVKLNHLSSFTSDHIATSGIGLLAHVASLLG